MSKGKGILTSQHSSHGGTNLAINILSKWGIKKMIDEYLGKRNARAEYSYGEIIMQFFFHKCCRGKRTEDLYDYRDDINNHPLLKQGMSPDTFLRMLETISVEHTQIKKENISKNSIKKVEKDPSFAFHQIYKIPVFNELLIDMAIKVGLIDLNQIHTLDVDTTIILTKAKGSRVVYNGNGKTGYHPFVGMIKSIPISIENRNGDTNASFNLVETLDELLNLLERRGIKIGMIRIDAAGFNKDLLAYLAWKGIKYITRANASRVKKEKNLIDNWTEEIIKDEPKMVGERIFKFGNEKVRLVVKKEFRDGKLTHWGLATNETNLTPKEIIQKYAKRGGEDCEKLFSGLNELHWDIMPKRKIPHNTVYLYVIALCYILYRAVVEFKAKRTTKFYSKMRFATFIKALFVTCKWLKKELKFLNKARDYIGLEEFFFFDRGSP